MSLILYNFIKPIIILNIISAFIDYKYYRCLYKPLYLISITGVFIATSDVIEGLQ